MRIARFCGSRFGSSNQRYGLPQEPRQACRRKCKKPAGERVAGGHLPRCKKQCLERRESLGQARELAARGILVEHALGDATLQFGLHRGERGGRRCFVARRFRPGGRCDGCASWLAACSPCKSSDLSKNWNRHGQEPCPEAVALSEGEGFGQPRCENVATYSRHCERSEAIQRAALHWIASLRSQWRVRFDSADTRRSIARLRRSA